MTHRLKPPDRSVAPPTWLRIVRRIAPNATRGSAALTLVAAGALLASVGYSLASLTCFPALYGDEAWIGSTAWSFVNGHGFRASISVGGGVYDSGTDYWFPRIGTLPFVIANLIAGPSFWGFRFAAFLIGVAALAIYVFGIRRRYGSAVATIAGAALSLSWGFFSTSHYVRWDSLAFVLACVLLVIFLRGPPSPRLCLLLGVMLGLTPDVETAVLSVAPALVLLVLWVAKRRRARLGSLIFGGALGLAAYGALHSFPLGGQADAQYKAVYAPAYPIPLKQAVEHQSLSPIWHERLRYDFMTPYAEDRLALYTLLAGLAGLVIVLAVVRVGRAYPVHLVPGLLLAMHLAGLALIEPNKAPVFAWLALPYAIASIAEGLQRLADRVPPWRPMLRVAAPFAALAVLAGMGVDAAARVERRTPQEPIFSKQFALVAKRAVRPGESVLGDYVYWWGFKNVDYHWNSWIWNYRWANDVALEPAFNRLCPDVVLFDSIWASRYPQAQSFGSRFPSMAPTHEEEGRQLTALLQREYRLRASATIDGREIQFWGRRAGACSGILTNRGGTPLDGQRQ